MSERKRRNKPIDFSDSFGFGEEKLFEQESIEGSSGYSISVTYDEKDKSVVKVRTNGDVDAEEIRKNIERQCPELKLKV